MSRSLLLILLGFGGIVMDDASNPLFAQGAYPRVVSPTGRFYGPTQAHYQYERQYGRPWYGGPAPYDPNTGANFQVQVPSFGWGGFYPGNPFLGNGYNYPQLGPQLPAVYGFPGYNGYAIYQNQLNWGPIQQYQVTPQQVLPQFGPAPVFSWQQPDPFQQQVIPQTNPRQAVVPDPPGPGIAAGRPVQAGAPEPLMQRPHDFMPANPSTVAQRQNSLHLQGQGDIWFRQQNYLQAYSRYKQAAAAAPDLAAPRFRMAYALMALRRYELAVPELQRGIKLDPQYPIHGESPSQVYGEENRLAAAALPQAVAAWVRQDIRSPDRLFLLGALLMISGDQARAKILLETAAEFGGPAEHFAAFLNLSGQPVAVAPQAGPPADDVPVVPESVEKMLKENRDWQPARPSASRSILPAPGPGVPQAKPSPVVESPVKTVAPRPDRPETKRPGLAPASGYVTIPKRRSSPPPEVETPEPETIEPASGSSSEEPSGPVIPIPGSGD